MLPKGTTLGEVFVPTEIAEKGAGEEEALNFFADSPDIYLYPVAKLERELEVVE